MKEEIINFQQAVALRECEFDWECDHYYTNGYVNDDSEDLTRVIKLHTANLYNHNKVIRESLCYSAPTQALAQKWMREVKNWHIIIEPYNYHGIKTTGYLYRLYNPIRGFENLNQRIGFDSYESALSAGIDASLELIKQK